VQDEPRVLRQHLEEPPRDVGSEAADAGLRQVDVRHEERLVARLEHHVRERLRRSERPCTVASRVLRPQRAGERVADRGSRRLDLRLCVSRLDVEAEVEPRGLREACEQLIEDG